MYLAGAELHPHHAMPRQETDDGTIIFVSAFPLATSLPDCCMNVFLALYADVPRRRLQLQLKRWQLMIIDVGWNYQISTSKSKKKTNYKWKPLCAVSLPNLSSGPFLRSYGQSCTSVIPVQEFTRLESLCSLDCDVVIRNLYMKGLRNESSVNSKLNSN